MTPIKSLGSWAGSVHLREVTLAFCLVLSSTIGVLSPRCVATNRPFTVADEIGLTHFGDPYSGQVNPVRFSPDGRYFVVDTERGRLDLNRPESELLVYQTEGVHRYLLHTVTRRPPLPFFRLRRSTYDHGPIITHIHWLSDSSGIAFLTKTSNGNDQLFLANIPARTVKALTPYDQHVTGFDIRNSEHFIYTVPDPTVQNKLIHEHAATTIVGTGRSIDSLIFPEDSYAPMWRPLGSDILWAVVNGKRFQVEDKSSGQPIHLGSEGQQALALSPDGMSVATALPVKFVPADWQRLYPAPGSSTQSHIKVGTQDVEGPDASWRRVNEYVRIDLLTGNVKQLTHAPIGNAAGWFGTTRANWSSDGESVILTNTFLPPSGEGSDANSNRPCIALIDLKSNRMICLERMKAQLSDGSYESGYHFVLDARFASDRKQIMAAYLCPDGSRASAIYTLRSDGTWEIKSQATRAVAESRTIDVSIEQGLNAPPLLVATDRTTKVSRTILNPNPQLKDIDLGKASVFSWQDKTGRNWTGGLYLPPDYVPGNRYPLVIQTHGFVENDFRPSGMYPTAFAARELSARGILVLQIPDCPIRLTPEEGPCQVRGYESAVEQLAAEGIVDLDQVGIIGFSRTCYYVLEALETSAVHFKAASITDGVNEGYVQYITGIDQAGNGIAHEADSMIGARPFGEGLHLWLEKSPTFNMDKIQTPLQVVALGRDDLLFMWEPYAALRYLNKPVDLILLAQDATHVLTNPAQRLVSQGGTVDWFQFWLKEEEDPGPSKTEQYARWRELRKLQKQNEQQAATAASPTSN